MKENDTVTYFGERFTVTEITGDNATIANEKHTYNVPMSTLQPAEPETKKEAPKKKAKAAK